MRPPHSVPRLNLWMYLRSRDVAIQKLSGVWVPVIWLNRYVWFRKKTTLKGGNTFCSFVFFNQSSKTQTWNIFFWSWSPLPRFVSSPLEPFPFSLYSWDQSEARRCSSASTSFRPIPLPPLLGVLDLRIIYHSNNLLLNRYAQCAFMRVYSYCLRVWKGSRPKTSHCIFLRSRTFQAFFIIFQQKLA